MNDIKVSRFIGEKAFELAKESYNDNRKRYSIPLIVMFYRMEREALFRRKFLLDNDDVDEFFKLLPDGKVADLWMIPCSVLEVHSSASGTSDIDTEGTVRK